MKIAVLGLGYVGVTAAACLASQGHNVIGVDPNSTKVNAILDGRSPIAEPGVEALISAAREKGLITANTTLGPDVAHCQLLLVCVGTPSAVDGSLNMSYVAEVTRQIAELAKEYPECRLTVAYRSTVRPGTMEELIHPIFNATLGEDASRVELVYFPEFLRESSAVDDYFSPPKVVIGTEAGNRCVTLDAINEGVAAPIFYVRYRESEITKFIDNSFHAVKIVFANEIGRVCSQLGIDPTEVHKIFVADTKLNISAQYLRPGGAFGGSCLPKDVRALQHISRVTGGFTYLIDALIPSNEAHKSFIFDRVTRDLHYGAKVLLLGIAFKNESDDLRESPNLDLARMLITAGYQLSIFDPFVTPQNLIGQNLGVLSNSPFVRKLLIDRAAAEGSEWDLVIDSRGSASSYELKTTRTVDINRLA